MIPLRPLHAAVQVLLLTQTPSVVLLLQMAFTLACILRQVHPWRHHQLLHSLLCPMRGIRVSNLVRVSSSS